MPTLKENTAKKKIFKHDFKIYNVTVLQVCKHQYYTYISYDVGQAGNYSPLYPSHHILNNLAKCIFVNYNHYLATRPLSLYSDLFSLSLLNLSISHKNIVLIYMYMYINKFNIQASVVNVKTVF